MNIVIRPKYIPLVQKPNCCGVTCLQMILYRRGYGLFDRQDLARYFRIKVGQGQEKFFNVKLDVYTKAGFDEGMKTIESENIINKFLKENKISLVAKAVRASEIENLETFIADNLSADNDLWVEFKIHKIYKQAFIHDDLIESIKGKKGSAKIVAIDPAPRNKPRAEINVKDLREAISKKYGRETGFLVIAKKNRKA